MAKAKRIKVEVPQEINDLTLGQWQEYATIPDSAEDEFRLRRSLQIFFDIRGDQYKDLRLRDVEKLLDNLTAVMEQDAEFKQRFTFKGIEYGFIPNMDKITFGLFADLEKYSELEDYHRAMSILYRPVVQDIGGRYKIAKYKGSHVKFKDMPLGIALGAVAFFLTLGEQLLNNILSSFPEVEQSQIRNLDLLVSGGGIAQSIRLLREKCGSIQELQT